MAKKLMSFRFSELSQRRLAELSAEWGVSATAVLERLLSEFGSRTRSLGKVESVERISGVEPTKPRVKFRSQVADPDRLAAFQRGMGKKK